MSVLSIDNPRACGLGEGEHCCAFLVMGVGGFQCGRTIPGLPEQIRSRLAEGTFNAKYNPNDTPYPTCQPFPIEGEPK